MRLGPIRTYVIRYSDTNDHGNWRQTVLVRVETTDGAVGWGEGIAMWPEACWATKLLVDGGFGPLLQQAGELTIEEAWTMMRRHAWWYGEGGVACFAYSALDMALWDIQGKLEGKPVYELLGGKKHDSLPAYACNHVNKATNALNIAEVVGFKEQGFSGCKLGFAKRGLSDIGKDPDNDVAFVAALRAALGDTFDIVVDAGNGVDWDRDTGISTARRMAEHNIGWLEEPFYPTRIEDYRALKNALPRLPIGTGEREFTVSGYKRLIETGTVDILGVDPARSEGITGFRKIDDLCGAAGIAINAHAWSTAILTAASLHLSIASPNARLIELKPFRVSVQTELVDKPIWHEDGVVHAPGGPGLGIEVDEKMVERLVLR